MYTVWLKLAPKPHNVVLKLNKWEINHVSEGGGTQTFVIIFRYITSFSIIECKNRNEKKVRNNIRRAAVRKRARVRGGCYLKLA